MRTITNKKFYINRRPMARYPTVHQNAAARWGKSGGISGLGRPGNGPKYDESMRFALEMASEVRRIQPCPMKRGWHLATLAYFCARHVVHQEVKVLHEGIGISDSDWDVFTRHVVATLDRFGVQGREREEFLAAADSLKGDIVEN